jgi:hypothetical protein
VGAALSRKLPSWRSGTAIFLKKLLLLNPAIPWLDAAPLVVGESSSSGLSFNGDDSAGVESVHCLSSTTPYLSTDISAFGLDDVEFSANELLP